MPGSRDCSTPRPGRSRPSGRRYRRRRAGPGSRLRPGSIPPGPNSSTPSTTIPLANSFLTGRWLTTLAPNSARELLDQLDDLRRPRHGAVVTGHVEGGVHRTAFALALVPVTIDVGDLDDFIPGLPRPTGPARWTGPPACRSRSERRSRKSSPSLTKGHRIELRGRPGLPGRGCGRVGRRPPAGTTSQNGRGNREQNFWQRHDQSSNSSVWSIR